MINKPRLFTGRNIGIPIVILIKGRGFINQGSTLRALAKAHVKQAGPNSCIRASYRVMVETPQRGLQYIGTPIGLFRGYWEFRL